MLTMGKVLEICRERGMQPEEIDKITKLCAYLPKNESDAAMRRGDLSPALASLKQRGDELFERIIMLAIDGRGTVSEEDAGEACSILSEMADIICRMQASADENSEVLDLIYQLKENLETLSNLPTEKGGSDGL